MTNEQKQIEFILQIYNYIDVWKNLDGYTEDQKLKGLAHSILALLDQSYHVIDQKGINIAGTLHERFYEFDDNNQ